MQLVADANVLLSAAIGGRASLALRHDKIEQVFTPAAAPAGTESNWVPTVAGGTFEVAFRFYGPEKPLFDKIWKLPDIEKVAAQAKATQ